MITFVCNADLDKKQKKRSASNMENVIGRGYIILMFMNLKLNNWTASNVKVRSRA